MSRCSRGLVMLSHDATCKPDGGRDQQPWWHWLCSLLISLRSTVPSAIFSTPTPQRDSFRSHTFSLFLALIDRLANLLSPDHQPLATANCLQPCYSRLTAYSQLPHHRLHSPRHRLSTACGTIKLQLSYKE